MCHGVYHSRQRLYLEQKRLPVRCWGLTQLRCDIWMSPTMSPISTQKFRITSVSHRPSTKETSERRTSLTYSRQPTAGVPVVWTGPTLKATGSLDSPHRAISRQTTTISLTKDTFPFIIRPGFDVSE